MKIFFKVPLSLLMLCTTFAQAGLFSNLDAIPSKVNTVQSASESELKLYKSKGLDFYETYLNENLKNLVVKVDRHKGEVIITFDYPSNEWGPVPYPVFVRLADKKGNILDSFTSDRDFAPKSYSEKMKPGTNGRRNFEDHPELGWKATRILNAKTNELKFDVNMRDAGFIQMAEVGFWTKSNHHGDSNPNNLGPKKVFLKDWAREK